MNKDTEIPDLPVLRKLYYKGAENAKTLKSLIKNAFLHGSGFPQTFTNKRYEGNQCRAGANRSFGDLLRLSRTYFPNTTQIELAKLIFELSKEIKIYAQFCHTVNKVVFRKSYDYQNISLEQYIDVYEDKVGVDKYSFNMIKKLAKN